MVEWIRKKYNNTLSTKSKAIGDIWWANVKYDTKGNVSKIRPVLVVGFTEDGILVKKISSKDKPWYTEIKCSKLPYKKSYLMNYVVEVKEYNMIRKIGRINR